MCPFLEKLVKWKRGNVTQFPWLTTHDKTMVFLLILQTQLPHCRWAWCWHAGSYSGMQLAWAPAVASNIKPCIFILLEASYFILLKSICFRHTLLWSPIQPWPHVSWWVLGPETLVRSNTEMTLFSLQLLSDLPANLHLLLLLFFFFLYFLTHGLVAQRTGSLVAKQIPSQETKCTSPILQVSPIYKRLCVSFIGFQKEKHATHSNGRWVDGMSSFHKIFHNFL